MKKTILFALMLLMSASVATAQKSKKTKGKAKAKSAVSGPKALASADNMSVNYVKNDLFLTLASKDTVDLRRNGLSDPTDVALKSINCGGSKLYLVTWTEKKKQGDAKSKLEDITQKHTMIVDVDSKTKVLANIESANHITEKVYLSSDKYVSETQEKVRREGFECALQPDGTVVLKNKSTQTKLVYDAGSKKFVAKK
ncbi:hypothetical protein [Flavobacterium selenitireducens]|uniref:hypothetical protein n=1 Tax=Flavobacterium selenitireducens TaxID=2722704 RepID=UPI00168C00EF|nr:hypothetical protein [Flavobacterium selenitireducens]MBD3581189.1 hypothetical protein [Flavobacterium selenitireducens]